jgi:hypothetical protein
VIDPPRASDGLDRVVRLLGTSTHPAFWAIACLALLLVLFEIVRAKVRRWFVSRRMRRQAGRALDAEARGASLLRRAGYTVTGSQVRGSYDILIDGRPFTVALRADYVVERRGRRFVAEVKSGELAPSLETAATRRQLLEYRIAFDVAGVLLVDAEQGSIHEVVFLVKSQAVPSLSQKTSFAPF